MIYINRSNFKEFTESTPLEDIISIVVDNGRGRIILKEDDALLDLSLINLIHNDRRVAHIEKGSVHVSELPVKRLVFRYVDKFVIDIYF